jgi:hypothetical protein
MQLMPLNADTMEWFPKEAPNPAATGFVIFEDQGSLDAWVAVASISALTT